MKPKLGTLNFTTSIACIIFAIFVAFISPLFPYFLKTLSVGWGIISSNESLRSEKGKTNILLLGLGGPKNEPSGLTDTILFASYNKEKNNALLLSLPRDIWIPQMQAKINTAFYYGNMQDGLGMEWSRKYVSEITGQPIHYVVIISFDGFTKLIDLLGGVEVEVEKSFTDTEYPILGRENDLCLGDLKTRCRYETLSFTQGRQPMDGTTALKFARSRHSEGEEGSDFSRSQRQQKIILAIREKVFSTEILLNPKKLSQAIKIIEDSIETDIPESHISAFIKAGLGAKDTKISSQILGSVYKKGSQDGFLLNPPIGAKYLNQYVLIPRVDSWQPAQEWILCLMEIGDCKIEDFTKSIRD